MCGALWALGRKNSFETEMPRMRYECTGRRRKHNNAKPDRLALEDPSQVATHSDEGILGMCCLAREDAENHDYREAEIRCHHRWLRTWLLRRGCGRAPRHHGRALRASCRPARFRAGAHPRAAP